MKTHPPHILTHYVDLHLALADLWRYMRGVLMGNWPCGLTRLIKDIACLQHRTFWLIIIRPTHKHSMLPKSVILWGLRRLMVNLRISLGLSLTVYLDVRSKRVAPL